jgi:hypothetical protein
MVQQHESTSYASISFQILIVLLNTSNINPNDGGQMIDQFENWKANLINNLPLTDHKICCLIGNSAILFVRDTW